MKDTEDLGHGIFEKELIEKALSSDFDFWNLDEEGNISKKGMRYELPSDRLTEYNWLNHILPQNDKSTEKEFYFVYIEALKRAGYKKITIDLEDPNNPIIASK